METHDPEIVEPAAEAPSPARSWQERHGATVLMAVFGLLVLGAILMELVFDAVTH